MTTIINRRRAALIMLAAAGALAMTPRATAARTSTSSVSAAPSGTLCALAISHAEDASSYLTERAAEASQMRTQSTTSEE
jgi:hypothetical protein